MEKFLCGCCLVMVLIMLRVHLSFDFGSSIVARWCDWALCSGMRKPHILLSVSLCGRFISILGASFVDCHFLRLFFILALSLSSLSSVRLLKLFCFVVYTVYLYCWVGRTHSVYEKYSPLSHIRIGLLINNVDGTCTPVEVFGFLSSNNISLFHFLGLPHACGPAFFLCNFYPFFSHFNTEIHSHFVLFAKYARRTSIDSVGTYVRKRTRKSQKDPSRRT